MNTFWTTDHREWYRNVYLQSEHWKLLRAAKLAVNPYCERCPSKACDVHHIRYRNIFDVELGDLLSLCRSCHNKEHEINGMPTRPKPKFKDDFDRMKSERDQELIGTYFKRKAKREACDRARMNRVWTKEEKKKILDERRKSKKKRPRILFGRELAPR